MIAIIFIIIACLSIPPFIPNYSIIGSLTIGDFLFLTISPIIIIKSNNKIIFNSISIGILVIGTISFLSLINSYLNLQLSELNLSNILYSFKWFYHAFLVSITTSLCMNRRLQKLFLNGIVAGCFLTLLITIYIWLQYPVFAPFSKIPMLHIIYIDGFSINRNYLGFVLSIGASISYGLYFIESNVRFKLFYLIISVIFFIALILTFSKGSWLSITALLFISFIRNIKRFKTYIISFIIFISTVYSSRFNIFENILRRITKSDKYNEIRLQFLNESFKLTLDNPILGVGPQAYKSAAIDYDFLPTVDPHNSFTWVSSELGLFSLMIICFIFVQTFKNIYFLYKVEGEPLSLPLLNLVIIFFIHSFLAGLTISSRYFWLIIGLTQGIIIYRKNFLKKRIT